MELKEQIKQTIVSTLNIKPQELKEGISLENSLGVDSTEMVELTVAISKKFNIKLADKEISKKSTLGDIENAVKSKL
ncbi:MAG: acyl carrier protein [Pseudomonadota bacterium]